MSAKTVAAPDDVAWLVTVTEPLPDCPSVHAAWARIATQSTWGSWRSRSKMRGPDVFTTVVPPATEPLQAGDAYVVKVGRWLRIRCRVVESSAPGSAMSVEDARVFDATGTAMGGLLRARFRFTFFREPGGPVIARAQERLDALPLLVPSRETLSNEHRHTLRDLNLSFRAGDGVPGGQQPLHAHAHRRPS